MLVSMSAELHLDPDGLRRAAVTARRLADGLDRADPGPPALSCGISAAGPAGFQVEQVQARLRESVGRARDELLALASAACAAAAGVDETDRAVAASLRAIDSGAGGRPPGPGPSGGKTDTDRG